MFKISNTQVQQQLRIAIYWAAGAFGGTAFLNGKIGQMALVAAATLFTWLWTMYATRIAAKINDLLKADVIEVLVTTDKATAESVDSTKVVSVADVNNPRVDTSTEAVKVLPQT